MRLRRLSGVVLATAAIAVLSRSAEAVTQTVFFSAPATPIGITIEAKRRALTLFLNAVMVRQASAGYVYADENGRSLYVFDDDAEAGRSTCTGSCAMVWLPAAVATGTSPVPGWSIVVRADGIKQWARGGKPLYTYATDREPGDSNGDGKDGKWHLASFDPKQEGLLPAQITMVPRINSTDAPALADSSGKTLYVYDGDIKPGKSACKKDCASIWHPATAPQLAKPFGEWSIIARADGTKQWAYRGKPLYSFGDDSKPGDSKGEMRPGWRPALVQEMFRPAEVSIGETAKGWTVFTTTSGMTLYARDIYRLDYGHTVNPAAVSAAEDGRHIGTAGCTGECTAVWRPIKAPAGVRSTGYWTVVMRDDGTRQWAYKGFPLYSYAGDKRPGDSFGHDTFDYEADQAYPPYWRVAIP